MKKIHEAFFLPPNNNLFRNPKQEQIALLFRNIIWKDAITFV